jgi:hypothetical protein
MKTLSDKNVLRWAAYAGFVAAAALLIFIVHPPVAYSRSWDLFLLLANALPTTIYWYGMSRLGNRIHSTLLHWAAIVIIITSILTDASNFFLTNFTAAYLSINGDGVMGTVYGIVVPAGLLLAGAAVLNARDRFGEMGILYGSLSIISAALLFFFGPGISLASWLSAALFVSGGIILLRSSR